MNAKMQLIEKLIRDGHIGLDEAIVLLETEKEYITVQPAPYMPYIPPSWPIQPYYGDPYRITCGTSTGSMSINAFTGKTTYSN